MPLDNLPAKLATLPRDQQVRKFLRDVQFRNPGINGQVGPGTQAWNDANVHADATAVHYSNAVTIANNVSQSTATGAGLDDWARRRGTARLQAVGAVGFVQISAASGGVTIFEGDLLKNPTTNLLYKVLATGLYSDGAQVPVMGTTTGPGSNVAAGTVLQWLAPRIGCGSTATVVLQPDGTGLSGGNDIETDDQLRARLDYIAANPPAAGNDAQVQALVLATPAISIQQVFTYPAARGPGTKAITFTLRPSTPGGNRIPNTLQLALAAAYLGGQMPCEDGYFFSALIASPTTIVLKLQWAQGAASWADPTPWPPYVASPNLVAVGTPASGGITALSFRLSSSGLSSSTAPQVGQSIALYDAAYNKFRRKKILTVTAISATQYDVTIDTSGGISDTSYTPTSGQAVSPWSDSLQTLVTPVLVYFDSLGPGEQFSAPFFDPGLRQKRSPASPQLWPNSITNRLLGGAVTPTPPSAVPQNQPPIPTLFTVPQLQDVFLQEPTVPFLTPTGSPGVSSNLLTLGGGFVAFPE